MLNILRVNSQPVHLFLQAIIAVPCVNHDGCAAFSVKENIGHILTYAPHVLINGTCVKGLKYFFAAIHPRHQHFLKL